MRQLFLVQYKQQAHPLLSMNNYTSLVISWNDKNKQLTLLSQRLAQKPQEIHFLHYTVKSLEHLKIKKIARPLFRRKTTIHLIKSQAIHLVRQSL
jgi:hypothetical protein